MSGNADAKASKNTKSEPSTKAPKKRRARLSQSDVPGYPVREAVRVPQAIRDEYGKEPTRPLGVAMALKMTPTGGTFRAITGASVAYGLTDGAAQSELVSLTDLGKRVVAPTVEGDDVRALAEAVLRPRVVREFLEKYDGSRVPSRTIALNVIGEMGVPTDAAERAFDMIVDNARFVGFLRTDHKGDDYVDLSQTPRVAVVEADEEDAPAGPGISAAPPVAPAAGVPATVVPGTAPAPGAAAPGAVVQPDPRRNKRVFISHGKNSAIVDQLKEVLTFGEFEPVVSVENESVSKPVPDKVMDDMRSCGAGIVHVGGEQRLMSSDGNERVMLNENVLIEIGAALALYRRNFILLVERGVTLPSNLQGLYEVRYEGDKLDYEATMKLLKAFNDFKLSTYEE